MKRNNSILCFLAFLLIGVFAYGQKVFKVTEGELQFINPEKGIILKKDNKYLQLKIYPVTNHNKFEFRTNISELNLTEFNGLKNNEKNIYSTAIVKNYDFNKLKQIKFVSVEKEENENYKPDIYEFFKYNNEVFVTYRFNYFETFKKYKVFDCREYSLFCYLNFGDEKSIIMTYEGEESFIIPTEKRLEFITNNYYFKEYKIIKKEGELSNKQNWFFSCLRPTNDVYRVDTLKNKKVQLMNYFNEKVIEKTFDKLELGHFVIGYNGNKIDLYNYHFKRFNLNNIRVIKSDEKWPIIQCINSNELKTIGLDGRDYKNEGFTIFGLPEADNSIEIFLHIDKENFSWSFHQTNNFPIINNENIEEFYFQSNKNDDFLVIEKYMNNKDAPEDLFIYYKNKNGTYGINRLGYFIDPDFKNGIYIEKYQNLQSVKGDSKKGQPNFKIEKNNLFMYFPLQKDFRYKTLGEFQGNFARFELPNGQKGWLDMDGKEYLDK